MPRRPVRTTARTTARTTVTLTTVLAAVLVAVGALAPGPAEAADGGRVTGTVSERGGARLPGIVVIAQRMGPDGTVDPHPESRGLDETDDDGSFEIAGLLPGDYLIEFRDDSGAHLDEYWQDEFSWQEADLVRVTAGSSTHLAARMKVPASIAGRVTDAGGAGLVGITVGAGPAWRVPGGSGTAFPEEATTDATGAFRITGLRPGRYQVLFSAPDGRFAMEQWRDTYPPTSGDILNVTEGQVVTGIDAQLEPVSSITGRVLDHRGEPTRGTPVHPYRWHPVRKAWEAVSSGNDTARGGHYRITGLPPGTYRLHFGFSPGGTWWNGGGSFTLAPGQDRARLDGRLPAPRVEPRTRPRLVGTVRPRATLRVRPGTWTPSRVSLTYRWYAGRRPLPGATRPTLRLTGATLRAARGRVVRVRVTARAKDHRPRSITLTARGRLPR